MSFTAEQRSCFGQPDGMEKRLAMWANQLSRDKSYPWVGTGLIADLKGACKMLGGEPDKQYPDMRKPEPAPVQTPAPPIKVEYDL